MLHNKKTVYADNNGNVYKTNNGNQLTPVKVYRASPKEMNKLKINSLMMKVQYFMKVTDSKYIYKDIENIMKLIKCTMPNQMTYQQAAMKFDRQIGSWLISCQKQFKLHNIKPFIFGKVTKNKGYYIKNKIIYELNNTISNFSVQLL